MLRLASPREYGSKGVGEANAPSTYSLVQAQIATGRAWLSARGGYGKDRASPRASRAAMKSKAEASRKSSDAAPRGGSSLRNSIKGPSPERSARRSAIPAGLIRPFTFFGRRIAVSP